MATYYCIVHKDEDQQALMGEGLHINNHMVIHAAYDLAHMREAKKPHQVIWEMERDLSDKYGWKFKRLVGIPA